MGVSRDERDEEKGRVQGLADCWGRWDGMDGEVRIGVDGKVVGGLGGYMEGFEVRYRAVCEREREREEERKKTEYDMISTYLAQMKRSRSSNSPKKCRNESTMPYLPPK